MPKNNPTYKKANHKTDGLFSIHKLLTIIQHGFVFLKNVPFGGFIDFCQTIVTIEVGGESCSA